MVSPPEVNEEDERKTWQQVALESGALRAELGVAPTGPLGPESERVYLNQLRFTLYGVIRTLRKQGASGFEDDEWPPNDFIEWTASATMRAVRFGVALATEGIPILALEQTGDGYEAAVLLAKQHFSSSTRDKVPTQHRGLAQVAFERSEMPDDEGAHPSRRLGEKLVEYAKAFYGPETTEFHSPYTSIVGPSGSGKTFSVKHLAEDEEMYVIYTSLSKTLLSVPGPGAIRDLLPRIGQVSTAMELWERYICVGRRLVEVAKDRGISPGMLFRMQYHENFEPFQRDIAGLVGRPSESPSMHAVGKIVDAVDLVALRYWQTTRNKRPVDPSRDTEANNMIIFCMDEARYLLHVPADETRDVIAKAAQPVAFRAFRRQLRELGKRDGTRLFGLLLDTSSRVQNFSPSAEYDPSIKLSGAQRTELFPPLYGIYAAWDGIAIRSRAVQNWLRTILVTNGTAVTVQAAPRATTEWYRFFYSLGRPLWGAILEAACATRQDTEENTLEALEEGLAAVRNLVDHKLQLKPGATDTERSHYHLAMLLFRLQFYVSDHKLSESCVADWMHYVRSISADRTTTQTVQPSEPVMAQHIAKRMQTSPAFRDEVVANLVRALHYGTLNVGDSGEIVAGLLLLLATDTMPAEKENGVQFLHRGLSDFLRTFCGWTTMPQHAAQTRIHVTHLGRQCTPGSITQKHLCAAFLTGEAWFMSANFTGVDLLVPVWQGPGQPMTALLIQVKNRQGPREITPALVKEARTSLGTGRALIEALRDEALPVYGLFLNLRPLGNDGRASAASETHEGSLTVYIQTGFSRETFGFLPPRLYEMLHGVVGAHYTGVFGKDGHGMRTMLRTRDGATFWASALASEDAMDAPSPPPPGVLTPGATHS